MTAVIKSNNDKTKIELDPYLYNNRISPFLNMIEKKINLDRSLIAFGMIPILAIYLVVGWGNDFVCNFIGIVYPVYASLAAVQSPETYDNKHLLIYWIVYSSLSCIEYIGYNLFNGLLIYWLAKCIFLVWFMMFGSRIIGRYFIRNIDALSGVQDDITDFPKIAANEVDGESDRYAQEIFSAVQDGDVQRLTDILNELDQREAFAIKKEALNMGHPNADGLPVLMIAAEQGYFDCVKLLVQAGADLELAPTGESALTKNLAGQTALFCAVKEGRQEIVKYLLDCDANPCIQNHYGASALWISAQKGMLQLVELLLDAGAEKDVAPFGDLADKINVTDWTPLYVAMKSRKFDVVKLLLRRGADPNAVTNLGSTPFLLASEICDLDIVEACIEAGAHLDFAPSGPDADKLGITGQTALFMATLKGHIDVVRFLITKGAQVNTQNRYGVSPLLLSAESGSRELVQALVQAGADVNIKPQGELAEENFLAKQTPLFGAAKKGHTQICEYLLQNGADVNAVTMTGATPLYTATEEDHLEVVELLILHGADVNRSLQGQVAQDLHIENQTPLLIACMRNHESIIRHLIQSGTNVNLRSERGSSPFLAICQHNNIELARLLIKHGAECDVEAKNKYDGKINGLIVAAESGSFDILRLLVEAGLDINYKIEGKGETAGRTPLLCACAKGFQEIVEYLINRGADVNGTEKSGLSCLHIAAVMGHADIVRFLCERGANVNQQYRFEEQDVTAYDLAESQQHDHVCQVLKTFVEQKTDHSTLPADIGAKK